MATLANRANLRSASPLQSRAQTNRSDAFLNVDVVLADGSTSRIGGIPLSLRREIHALLIEAKDQLGDVEFKINLNLVEDKQVGLGFKSKDQQKQTA
ncbi:hypothetical protein [Alteromonas sp. RKMC-009]|uniref:hypothetical protein n=1 Tax=Alteromonas sp. RKMC-009 TaxID=2267264 RepID=UPI000E67C7CE|nr:hypothetical protein [Alteromonas sp. RKMC-009]AYA64306.1 hypothetical protein DS731_10025 [Alteromonas sp. RKMC-009]